MSGHSPQPAMDTASLSLVVSRFPTVKPKGPAIGEMQTLTWRNLSNELSTRRIGQKDGENFVYARFEPEPDGRVRRLSEKVSARTAIPLDCETNSKTGEVPPSPDEVLRRLREQGWEAVVYTSHNHTPQAPRYRIILPLTAELAPTLPAVEVVASILGLSGVLDQGKLGASSVFYKPSASSGQDADHIIAVVKGAPIDAEWMRTEGEAIMATREAAQAKIRLEALQEAERRRAERARTNPDQLCKDNLIEGIRSKLDLEAELLRHGYAKHGKRYLCPSSQSGIPGVHILSGSDGIERVFSHHASDPLSPENLPSWCFTKAVDAVDVAVILEYNGNLKKGLHGLGKRFGIGAKPSKPKEQPAQEKAQPGSGTVWHEAVDFLVKPSSAAPVLKPKHIPDALWPFVTDTAERMGADPFAVALAALVSCAAIASDDFAIQPKRHDSTWTENPRIWGAIVGSPSILKTPVISAATKPIDRLEAEARKANAEAMKAWKVQENQARIDKVVPPPQPKLRRYMVEGTTIEALSEILRDDEEAKACAPQKKLLSRQDEMSEFFGGLDRYKAGGKGGSERGAYLRLYNGGRHTVDRIARGSFAVPNWSACFIGGIQPGPIQKIARDAAEDGLLQRFIYCVPDGQKGGTDRKPDERAIQRYAALFPALAAFTPPTSLGEDYPRPLVFHAEAHRHREDINALAEALSAVPDTSDRMKAAYGKWPGLFARLCLIFHLIDVVDHRARNQTAPVLGVIPESVAIKVSAFIREIVYPHALRAEATMFSTNQTGHAQWVAGFILSKGLQRISTRDIIQAYRELRAPEARRELDAVMASLVAVGWLEPEEPSNPSKPVTSWQVNPEVHVTFAEHAKAEADRRADATARIAEAVKRVRAAKATA